MDKFLNNMELITGTIKDLEVINKKSKIKIIMHGIKRESEIISLIKANGDFASVEYLAETLNLSPSTVRRNLQELELKVIEEPNVFIVDDNFLVSCERIKTFCKLLDENIGKKSAWTQGDVIGVSGICEYDETLKSHVYFKVMSGDKTFNPENVIGKTIEETLK